MFWELIWKFLLLASAIAYLALGAWVTLRIQRKIAFRIKRYYGRKMVAKCKELGPKLYRNKVGKTLAVCRVEDYTKALRDKRQPWEIPEHVLVQPTFLFLQDGSPRNRMYVNATMGQALLIVDDLLTKLTGYTRKQVDNKSFEEATLLIAPRNENLFVPLSSKLSQEERNGQAEFYGSAPSIEDARRYLLK